MQWQELASVLVDAWGCWGASVSPDDQRVAYVSDRTGRPELWVQDVDDPAGALHVPLSADPVLGVRWSADNQWLACAVATDGGVRSEVWLVRPDGRDARRVAGGNGLHATMGPWSHAGARLVVTRTAGVDHPENACVLLDAHTGQSEPLASGALVHVLDITADERFALLQDGTRGAEFCVLLDRVADQDHPLLPFPGTGSTDTGILRRSPDGSTVAYLISDAGQPRRALLAVSVTPDGGRDHVGTLARRRDGELEFLSGDDAGTLLALGWNVAGRSELDLLELRSNRRRTVSLPGAVISGLTVSRSGRSVLLTLQSPDSPRRIWHLDPATGDLTPVTPSTLPETVPIVSPELLTFSADDGLPLSGWLYEAPAVGSPAPVMIYLHGGPESQERPGFEPQHQVLTAAGVTVFAPNIRGSSGFGRSFVHADDRYGRYDAIADVRRCVDVLVEKGIADPERVVVAGRSYGGYLTLTALVHYPELFAAGVDICGMSDLLTFYRDSEPWIAAAAVTKYGDPVHDQQLLHDLSPINHADRIAAPVLVVHGELDTNVPIGEARRIVATLRRLERPVEYLQLDGEGHEYRRASSRLLLLERIVTFLGERITKVG